MKKLIYRLIIPLLVFVGIVGQAYAVKLIVHNNTENNTPIIATYQIIAVSTARGVETTSIRAGAVVYGGKTVPFNLETNYRGYPASALSYKVGVRILGQGVDIDIPCSVHGGPNRRTVPLSLIQGSSANVFVEGGSHTVLRCHVDL